MLQTSDWFRQEGFIALSATEFLACPSAVRNAMGVYMILLANAEEILARAGLPETEALAEWSISNHQHVYTGKSVGIRSRALLHLTGTVRDSAVREYLLALQFSRGVLWDARDEKLNVSEVRLTEWLSHNAWVAFRPCSYILDVEEDLIRRLPSPFNSVGNLASDLGRLLKVERDKFRRHVKATGQVPHRESKPRSAWFA